MANSGILYPYHTESNKRKWKLTFARQQYTGSICHTYILSLFHNAPAR